MMTSCRNLTNITQDAVPRANPLPTEIQPVVNHVAGPSLGGLGMAGLPASVVNVLNNTTNHGPGNLMVINKSKGIHVGNVYKSSVSIVKKTKSDKKTKDPPTPSPDIQVMLDSSLCVTTAHVKDVKIGKPWRRVMRHLGLLDPEIDNRHEEYFHQGGIEEVVYQLLRLWTEKNGSTATLDKLSKALWCESQWDALTALVDAYGINKPSSPAT